MNHTTIEWVKNADGSQGYTWNPLTGCLHGCYYCYARRIARRFGKTEEERAFKPVFHPERLNEPQRIKKPSTIFVCSMADLFGEWVPDEQIVEIMEACRKAPRHLCLFLTKNPRRYKTFIQPWPEKYMVGTTSVGGDDRPYTSHHKSVSFVSFEPLLKPVNMFTLVSLKDTFSWAIVGAMTGPGAVLPELKWIKDLVNECKRWNTPIFLKNNLKDIWPGELVQEVPWVKQNLRGEINE